MISDIPVGKIVELEVEIEEYVHHMNSKVEYGEGDELYISRIKNSGTSVKFKDSYKINLIYNSSNGLYIWRDVKIVSKVAANDMFHCIKSSESGQRYNRRNAFRVFVGEKSQVMVVKNEKQEEVNKIIGSTIKDISESGIGIIIKEKVCAGSVIGCILKDDNGKVINIEGKVVRCDHIINSSEYICGCTISESSPELVKYIFNRQRKNLKGRHI